MRYWKAKSEDEDDADLVEDDCGGLSGDGKGLYSPVQTNNSCFIPRIATVAAAAAAAQPQPSWQQLQQSIDSFAWKAGKRSNQQQQQQRGNAIGANPRADQSTQCPTK
jgi:hypothetical protein